MKALEISLMVDSCRMLCMGDKGSERERASFIGALYGAPLVFGFAHRRMDALFRLGLAERVAWRRDGFTNHVEHGPLLPFLGSLAASLLHGINRQKRFPNAVREDAMLPGRLVSISRMRRRAKRPGPCPASIWDESAPRLQIRERDAVWVLISS